MPNKARRVVLLAVPPVEELDLVAPVEVFGTANRLLRPGKPVYSLEVVSNTQDGRIDGECGLSLLAHRHYRDVEPRPDSVLLICGVAARNHQDAALSAWLRSTASTVRRLGAVCVGAFLLAQAGLLDRKRATVHWKYARELAVRHPLTAVDPNPIWVQDGNIYTSAGISAGIDLALAWVEQDHGAAAAMKVARELVLFLRRPGGQDQFSASLAAQALETRSIHELQVWMAENLEKKLDVDVLARRAAMSPRNFARVFNAGDGDHAGALLAAASGGSGAAPAGADRKIGGADRLRLWIQQRRSDAPRISAPARNYAQPLPRPLSPGGRAPDLD